MTRFRPDAPSFPLSLRRLVFNQSLIQNDQGTHAELQDRAPPAVSTLLPTDADDPRQRCPRQGRPLGRPSRWPWRIGPNPLRWRLQKVVQRKRDEMMQAELERYMAHA